MCERFPSRRFFRSYRRLARLGRQAARTALAELGAQGAEWHETLELRVPETPGAGRLDLEARSAGGGGG